MRQNCKLPLMRKILYILLFLPLAMLGQGNNFSVSSCHPYHIDNGYHGNFFGVSPSLLFNIGETVITITFGELNHTFTVTGSGGYSLDDCIVTYLYFDGTFNDLFNGPLLNGANIQVHGCTNSNANNYNIQASIEDYSCLIEGCTNVEALNYNPSANVDDSSCIVSLDELSTELSNLYQQQYVAQTELMNYFSCEEIVQDIPISLNLGWNMIGYTCEDDEDASMAFYDIDDKIVIVKNSLGNAYLPEWGFNGIGSLIFAQGYQIKVSEEITDFQFCSTFMYGNNPNCLNNVCDIEGCTNLPSLNFNAFASIDDGTCTENINEILIIIEEVKFEIDSIQNLLNTQPTCNISFENSPLYLTDGWNMFGYTCLTPIDAAEGFYQIQDQIIIVKDGEGSAYLPEWEFNGIGQLNYAKGYQIKVQEDVLNFQFCPKVNYEETPGCQEFYFLEEECYEQYFIDIDVEETEISKFVINAARWREICEVNLGHLKNPLFSINKNGQWSIYYHVENWLGPVMGEAITNLTATYEDLANQWLNLIADYDESAPPEVNIRVFGFVFNEGVELDESFYEIYGDYPIVTNWQSTNEETPWEIRFKNNNDIFNQNWYEDVDYTEMYVAANRTDVPESVNYFPILWDGYIHPEGVNMFFTKFWHKTNWDAVAQRQYLKVGGQIQNYATGTINTSVFGHEMGHCFFHDDIYDIVKYPDNQNLISIMKSNPNIADFDAVIQRMVWEKQRELD